MVEFWINTLALCYKLSVCSKNVLMEKERVVRTSVQCNEKNKIKIKNLRMHELLSALSVDRYIDSHL
jgi:hypothetical protein